jgi:hypothetical protein
VTDCNDITDEAMDILPPVETSDGNVEHDYAKSTPETCITFYLGGYVAHKLSRFTTCEMCVTSLSDAQNISADSELVELKTKGGLKLPSQSLTNLLKLLEISFQKYSLRPNTNMYFDILDDVLTCSELPKFVIGCEKHATGLTSRCIHFYVSTRLHFLRKCLNKSRESRATKHKMSKISKLT